MIQRVEPVRARCLMRERAQTGDLDYPLRRRGIPCALRSAATMRGASAGAYRAVTIVPGGAADNGNATYCLL